MPIPDTHILIINAQGLVHSEILYYHSRERDLLRVERQLDPAATWPGTISARAVCASNLQELETGSMQPLHYDWVEDNIQSVAELVDIFLDTFAPGCHTTSEAVDAR
jgi:hypothetical protein